MMIEFNLPSFADVLQVVVTAILPLIVGWVTRQTFQHKALVLLTLAAVTGLGTELLAAVQAGTVFDLTDALVRTVLSFIAAVGLHYGLYKPEGVTAAVQSRGPQ
jgi:hypothetical protein